MNDETAEVVPDRLLLQGMAQGSSAAAGELRRRHAKSLYALAYGVLWDTDGADAVVMQAFDQAARTGGEFPSGHGSVFRWLSGIARARAELLATAIAARERRHRGAVAAMAVG